MKSVMSVEAPKERIKQDLKTTKSSGRAHIQIQVYVALADIVHIISELSGNFPPMYVEMLKLALCLLISQHVLF